MGKLLATPRMLQRSLQANDARKTVRETNYVAGPNQSSASTTYTSLANTLLLLQLRWGLYHNKIYDLKYLDNELDWQQELDALKIIVDHWPRR